MIVIAIVSRDATESSVTSLLIREPNYQMYGNLYYTRRYIHLRIYLFLNTPFDLIVSISIKSMTTKALLFTVHYKVYSNYVFKFVYTLNKKLYVRCTE